MSEFERLARALQIFGEYRPGSVSREAWLQRHEAHRDLLELMLGGESDDSDRVAETLTTPPPDADRADTPTRGASSPTRAVARLDFTAGDRIGPYRILESIGHGGMGEVYLAQQSEPIRRRVALKVVKLGYDTQEVLARFRAEYQTLSLMSHPGIARVFDAGATDTGRLYFVMEYVPGVPITEFCDRNRTSVEERIELLIEVCRAVEHAHQKGIIHRDLKPSNILVMYQEGQPTARVIDFGIAKSTMPSHSDQTVYTRQGVPIGTLEYMSPEQVEAAEDIDTRTDVYALGVVLYQLLSGQLPFEPSRLRSVGLAELQRILREVEPLKPSTRLSTASVDDSQLAARVRNEEPRTLVRTLRGDLDWIVMRCLEKDRTRRYASVAELADDLRRHLQDEPVVAGPPSFGYRARKFVRRNRALAFGGLAIVIGLCLAVAGSTAGLFWALDERDRAEKAEKETAARAADLERVVAFQSEQLGELDPLAFGIDLRASILEAVGPDRRAEVERELSGLNFTNVARRTLDRSVFDRALRTIDEQFAEKPLIRAELLHTTALTMRHLGLWDRAKQPQEEAVAIRRRELGDDHVKTLDSLDALGSLLRLLREVDAAGVVTREVLERCRRVLPPDDPLSVRAIYHRGNQASAEDDHRTAEQFFREAWELLRRTAGDDHEQTFGARIALANARWESPERESAIELYEKISVDAERALGADHRMTFDAVFFLGRALGLLGKEQPHRLPAAIRHLQRSLEIKRRVLGDEHPSTSASLERLVIALDDARDVDGLFAVLQSFLTTDASTKRLRKHAQRLGRIGGFEEEAIVWQGIAAIERERFGEEYEGAREAEGRAEELMERHREREGGQ